MYSLMRRRYGICLILALLFQIKALLSKDVTVCQIPHVDGLRSGDLIKFIVEDWDGEDFLPKNYIDYIPNRAWLANICNNSLSNYIDRQYSWFR